MVRSIRVVDANGTILTVQEHYEGLFFRRVRCWKLATGERVARSSSDTFVVLSTGEELLIPE
jgi:hypothetical protein